MSDLQSGHTVIELCVDGSIFKREMSRGIAASYEHCPRGPHLPTPATCFEAGAASTCTPYTHSHGLLDGQSVWDNNGRSRSHSLENFANKLG